MSRCPNQYTVQTLDLCCEPIPETKPTCMLKRYDRQWRNYEFFSGGAERGIWGTEVP